MREDNGPSIKYVMLEERDLRKYDREMGSKTQKKKNSVPYFMDGLLREASHVELPIIMHMLGKKVKGSDCSHCSGFGCT